MLQLHNRRIRIQTTSQCLNRVHTMQMPTCLSASHRSRNNCTWQSFSFTFVALPSDVASQFNKAWLYLLHFVLFPSPRKMTAQLIIDQFIQNSDAKKQIQHTLWEIANGSQQVPIACHAISAAERNPTHSALASSCRGNQFGTGSRLIQSNDEHALCTLRWYTTMIESDSQLDSHIGHLSSTIFSILIPTK